MQTAKVNHSTDSNGNGYNGSALRNDSAIQPNGKSFSTKSFDQLMAEKKDVKA